MCPETTTCAGVRCGLQCRYIVFADWGRICGRIKDKSSIEMFLKKNLDLEPGTCRERGRDRSRAPVPAPVCVFHVHFQRFVAVVLREMEIPIFLVLVEAARAAFSFTPHQYHQLLAASIPMCSIDISDSIVFGAPTLYSQKKKRYYERAFWEGEN